MSTSYGPPYCPICKTYMYTTDSSNQYVCRCSMYTPEQRQKRFDEVQDEWKQIMKNVRKEFEVRIEC